MHRFRKKSDAQRTHIPTSSLPFDSPPSNALPELPPTNDFRTSLILPDLSRRFSLLRSSTGDPVSLDDLRSRLANQRARGAENQISEEEEDMLLETLGRIRGRHTHTPTASQENVDSSSGASAGTDDASRNSVRSAMSASTTSISSSTGTTSTGTPRTTKRYSNNLFGSGRLRDYTYLKSVAPSSGASAKGSGSSTRTVSLTPTEASMAASHNMSSTSLRPTTPDGTSPPVSVQSSPNAGASTENGSVSIHSAPLIPPAPFGESLGSSTSFNASSPSPSPSPTHGLSITDAEYRLQKRLGPVVLKRASIAIEQAIKEIEDEVEDEIVLPRSVPIQRSSLDQGSGTGDVRNSHASHISTTPSTSSSVFEGGMAISIDKTIHDEFSERRASPVPVRTQTVPGYVPGMPRPMTPRDFDFDEQRSHSTTPRAQSPYLTDPPASPTATLSGYSPSNNNATPVTKIRRDSTSSGVIPMAAAPLFLQRTTNGRYTPTPTNNSNGDENKADSSPSIEFESPLNSSLLGRRRPASPLSGPPFQPMAVSPGSRPNSRPSTPSNVIWTPNTNGNGMGNGNGHRHTHSRSGSWTTDSGMSSTDFHGTIGAGAGMANKPAPRSLKSPALPDSPMLDTGEGHQYSFASAATTVAEQSPQSYIPDVDLGSPILAATHAPRSPTPTQSQQVPSQSQAQRSPISPAFSHFDLSPRHNSGSKRSSRQNPPSSSPPSSPSPFHLSSFSGLGGFAARGGANSSRSSLDSVGSSFHSWDDPPDKVLSVFSDAKEQQAAWHDLKYLSAGKEKPAAEGEEDESTDDSAAEDGDMDAEDVLKKYGGLKKADIAVIQEKLVAAAFMKIANTDPRDRAPSALRRRRPSTSQSNYSRIASPPPQVQPPASPAYAVDEQFSKASALLNSVVESIKDQPAALNTSTSSQQPSTEELSPNTRRGRDLARVLFGGEEAKDEDETVRFEPTRSMPSELPQPIASTSSGSSTTDPVFTPIIVATPATATTPSLSDNHSTLSPSLSPPAPPPEPAAPLVFPSPYLHTRNPSTPRIPQTPQEEAELTREVQQKADAAMLALNKNPSKVNLPELRHTGSIRRRVSPSQISTPTLVSTTTSVETVPLPASVNGNVGPSKLGSRFRKLRGSLRAKPVVPIGEEPSAPEVLRTPPASQTAYYDPAKLSPQVPSGPSSASDSTRFKVPVTSPPASSGPGLKGFMARFRNKQRMSEMPSASPSVPLERGEHERQEPRAVSPLSPNLPLSPRSAGADPTTPKAITTPTDRSHNVVSRPAGQPRPMYSRFPPANPPSSPTPSSSQPPATGAGHASGPGSMDASQSAAALEQLFAAATNLGLDQNALNDLLARSGSTSSRNHLLARNNSVAVSGSRPGTSNESGDVPQVAYVGSSSSEQTATPTDYGKSLVPDSPVTPEETVSRKPSTRRTDQLRRPREGQADNTNSVVVRRTIIFANDAPEFAALIQRKTSTRRKRASATSVSNRSLHDRAPTPPPPKSPAIRRFSADGLPPMPQLPNFLGQGGEKMLSAPSTSTAGPNEKSNSTYDSLYDMYAGESRAASMAVVDPAADGQSSNDQPALEVIQLANGETVWSIINGLRDDDESVYSRPTSFTSEYSTREPSNDSPQLFAKGHSRSGSRGSVTSFISKKKNQQQGKTRPETKVFYSSSAQIGRLIESLSQGADAGSFNIVPNAPNGRPGHSTSSSLSTNDINWTVEERLDRMLGAMNNS